MNKLLTLTNVELKRNSRFYFIYIVAFSLLTLAISILQTNNFKKNISLIEHMTEKYGGITYGTAILYNNNYIYPIILVGMLGLLMYSCYMWIKEYTQANKSIYTLIMIPENKFIIYLSKMIATITMIYVYMISQIAILFVGKSIFSLYFMKSNLIKTHFVEDLVYGSAINSILGNLVKAIIPLNFSEFIMYYVVVLILLISIVFIFCLIGISLRHNFKGAFWVPMVVLYTTYLYIANRFDNNIYYVLGDYVGTFYNVDLLINILTIIVLNIASYILINKKLYI